MAAKIKGKYNEPLLSSRGDVFPRVKRMRVKEISAMVRARLEVENELGKCGNEESTRRFVFTAVRMKVLLAILKENDSPFSASLRADAASVAGGIKDKRVVFAIRKIAIDEREDLETRLNAVQSYIQVAGQAASRDLRKLLSSKQSLVRQQAYLSAFRSHVSQLVTEAARRLKREPNKRIKKTVSRKVPILQSDSTLLAGPPRGGR